MRNLINLFEGDVVPFPTREPEWTDHEDGTRSRRFAVSTLTDTDIDTNATCKVRDERLRGKDAYVNIVWHDVSVNFPPMQVRAIFRLNDGDELELIEQGPSDAPADGRKVKVTRMGNLIHVLPQHQYSSAGGETGFEYSFGGHAAHAVDRGDFMIAAQQLFQEIKTPATKCRKCGVWIEKFGHRKPDCDHEPAY